MSTTSSAPGRDVRSQAERVVPLSSKPSLIHATSPNKPAGSDSKNPISSSAIATTNRSVSPISDFPSRITKAFDDSFPKNLEKRTSSPSVSARGGSRPPKEAVISGAPSPQVGPFSGRASIIHPLSPIILHYAFPSEFYDQALTPPRSLIVNLDLNTDEEVEKPDRNIVPEAEFPPEPLYSYQIPHINTEKEKKMSFWNNLLDALLKASCVILFLSMVFGIGFFVSKRSNVHSLRWN